MLAKPIPSFPHPSPDKSVWNLTAARVQYTVPFYKFMTVEYLKSELVLDLANAESDCSY